MNTTMTITQSMTQALPKVCVPLSGLKRGPLGGRMTNQSKKALGFCPSMLTNSHKAAAFAMLFFSSALIFQNPETLI